MNSLEDKAAIWLEENHISGDTLIKLNHNIEENPNLQGGSVELAVLLADFYTEEQETLTNELTEALEELVSLTYVIMKHHKLPMQHPELHMAERVLEKIQRNTIN